ncbi:hypothetical protein PVIIG_05939 [Plasmodium vivax India VII]|uniref:Uncharacterized protein n=1 Tax=Plasmodium vivax India VII TaxID=1077284 RepID=A0A0J9VA50_PLAVI|nr:hypothetical protein PVIIG_05939 [Plasmodium vivax India VII]
MNSGKLQSKCLPDKLTTPVKLSELKNRIFSYIYFKNLEKIKTISTSKNKDDCTKYLTYLESFKPVHDTYKYNNCASFFFSSPKDTDYFPCKDKRVLESRITELQKCKIGDKENLKAVASDLGRSKNNKCSHYNKYGNYNKFIKSRKIIFVNFIGWRVPNIRTSIIFRGITNFVKFIKNIG